MKSEKYPIEEIRDRCDLAEIISGYVALKKSGNQLRGLCPFHSEKTPSFFVSPDKGIWKCYGCGAGGDLYAFIQRAENLSFVESVEFLARKAGVFLESSEQYTRTASKKSRLYRSNKMAADFFSKSLKNSAVAMKYLADRGLAQSSIEKFGIGYAPNSWDALRMHLERNNVSSADAVGAGLIVPRERSTGFYDRFRDRLMFPIVDISDRIIAFGGRIINEGEPKYLNSPESEVFRKTKTLYALNFARRNIPKYDRIIVVEGYLDAITAHEAGFEDVAATLGTALTVEHVELIARYTKNVVLCYDADSAGMAAALKGAPIFENAGLNVAIMTLPKGEDPDSLLRRGDIGVFANLVDKALPVVDYKLRTVVLRFDLKTSDGKTQALKEAVKVVSEVESTVERERLIRLLARFHPNFGSGTTRAEDHIRADIEKERTLLPQNKQPALQAKTEVEKITLSLREKTERVLLGMIICKNVSSTKVFTKCPSKDFMEGKHRTLAVYIDGLARKGDSVAAADLYTLLEDEEVKDLLTDLVVGIDDAEYDQPVDMLLDVLDTQKKNERLALVREITKKVQNGEITRSDPEYEEYIKLIKETSSPFRR